MAATWMNVESLGTDQALVQKLSTVLEGTQGLSWGALSVTMQEYSRINGRNFFPHGCELTAGRLAEVKAMLSSG